MASSKRILLFLCLAGSSVFPAGAAANPLTTVGGVELAPWSAGAGDSACPAKRPAFLGGFYGELGARSGVEITGLKMRQNGWRVLVTNASAETRGVNVESYCTQLRNPPLLEAHSATVPVAPLSAAVAVARCPRGRTLLAGGFRSSVDPRPGGRHVVVDGMRRVGAATLQISAVNLSQKTGTATAYAYCGRGQRPVLASRTVEVAPNSSERLVAECPGHRGQYFGVFGGFQGSAANAVAGTAVTPAQFRYFARSKIVVTAVNRGSEAGSMTAFIYCRKPASRRRTTD